jgi:protein-tyrosine phosphatase
VWLTTERANRGGGAAAWSSRTLPPVKVLFLCTANLCRSPMAETLLARHLRDLGVEASIGSAGRGAAGLGPPPQAVTALAGRGVDLASHRSRSTTVQLLQDANLVVGMAREHVRDAVALDPDVWSRAFTLKEVVRRGEIVGPRRADESVRDWAARVGAGRSPTAMLGSAKADDVADPVGGPAKVYRRTLQELDGLTGRLASLLAAPGRATPPAPPPASHADRPARP